LLEALDVGSGISVFLVVMGSNRGTVWEGCEDFYPRGIAFSAWYRQCTEQALRASEDEKIIPLLQIGMSQSDVIAEVGGNWKTRKAMHRPVTFMEASDIPAQLELDEREIVVAIKPWPFISSQILGSSPTKNGQ